MRESIKVCIAVFVLIYFSSCATILNSRKEKIGFVAKENLQLVSIGDSVLPVTATLRPGVKEYIRVTRSRQPLPVVVRKDSVQRTIALRSAHSFAFWLNLFYNSGIGMIVDAATEKRFSYPKTIHLSMNNFVVANHVSTSDSISVNPYQPVVPKKGHIDASFTLPFATGFRVATPGGDYESVGMLGLEAGADYFCARKKYISINAGVGSDRMYGDYFADTLYRVSTQYISASHHHLAGDFDFGYGVSLSRLKWSRYIGHDSSGEFLSVKRMGLDLSLSAHYCFTRGFRLGILYQPRLVSLEARPDHSYHYYFSVNLMFKIPVRKR